MVTVAAHPPPKVPRRMGCLRGDGRNRRGPSEDTAPRSPPLHLPGLGLPWAAPEAPVRDWGFMGSPGAEQLPALGTWM